MKIALIGYGKMGKAIEQMAISRGHSIQCIIDEHTDHVVNKLSQCDVAIEFTQPGAAVANIKKCFEAGIPVLVGTTGWYDRYDEIKKLCERKQQTLFTATNFSIGVNLFFYINRILAQAMENLPEYEVSIEEVHHVHKLDAPSGTAITTAKNIMLELTRKTGWKSSMDVKIPVDTHEINIISKRIDDVPGTHTVTYNSDIDSIDIIHTAHNRKGFAVGAIVAAEWVNGKKGVFDMDDLIGF